MCEEEGPADKELVRKGPADEERLQSKRSDRCFYCDCHSVGTADSRNVCLRSFEKSKFARQQIESEKTCMTNLVGQIDFDIAFPALRGSADDRGVVRSMISAIEKKGDSESGSGGIGALEQRKTVGTGRSIGAVGDGGRSGLIGDKGKSVEVFVDGAWAWAWA